MNPIIDVLLLVLLLTSLWGSWMLGRIHERAAAERSRTRRVADMKAAIAAGLEAPPDQQIPRMYEAWERRRT